MNCHGRHCGYDLVLATESKGQLWENVMRWKDSSRQKG